MRKNLIATIGCLPVVIITLLSTVFGGVVVTPGPMPESAVVVPGPTPWSTWEAAARSTAIEHAGSGWLAYYAENYTDAETEFTAAIEADPTWVEGYMGRAMVYLAQERWAESERDFTKVIERDPNDAVLYAGFRAYVRLYLGDFQGALDDCNQTIRLGSHHRFGYSNAGWANSNMNNFEEAIANYTTAMTWKPEESYYYYQRANFSEMLWDLNQAEMDRYLMRGFRSFGCEMCEDAIAYFTLAANYQPASGARPPDINYAYAWYGLGRQHFASEDYELALAAFQTAIELAPTFPHPLAWAGKTATVLGDYAAAASYFDQAVTVEPRYAEGYLLRAEARDAAGDHAAALADYGQWVRWMEARSIDWNYVNYGEPFIVALDESFVYYVTVWGEAGQTLSVTADAFWSTSGVATSLVLITDSAGEILAGKAAQLPINQFVSADLTLPSTGMYTVVITHLAEFESPARVTIDVKPSTGDAGPSS